PDYVLALSPDGRTLAVSGYWGVLLLDATTGRELHRIEGQYGLVFSPDGKTLATDGTLGTLGLLDVTTGKQLWPHGAFPNQGHWVMPLAFLADGKILLACEDSHKLVFLDRATGMRLRNGLEFASPHERGAFVASIDGKLVATASRTDAGHL